MSTYCGEFVDSSGSSGDYENFARLAAVEKETPPVGRD